jgi:hypothetical protein
MPVARSHTRWLLPEKRRISRNLAREAQMGVCSHAVATVPEILLGRVVWSGSLMYRVEDGGTHQRVANAGTEAPISHAVWRMPC